MIPFSFSGSLSPFPFPLWPFFFLFTTSKHCRHSHRYAYAGNRTASVAGAAQLLHGKRYPDLAHLCRLLGVHKEQKLCRQAVASRHVINGIMMIGRFIGDRLDFQPAAQPSIPSHTCCTSATKVKQRKSENICRHKMAQLDNLVK